MPSPPDLARLRARIAALEGVGGDAVVGAVPLGVAEVDVALPWGGLALGCLHEVCGHVHEDGIPDGAAVAFAAVLLGRLATGGVEGDGTTTAGTGAGFAPLSRPVLWIGPPPYAPGVATLGLEPDRVVMVDPRRPADVLWAMEEGLRCRALAGVLGDVRRLDLTAARRLQLAARASGVPALVLNHGEPAGVAVTRWRVAAAPSRCDRALGVGRWCWRVELARCRGRGADEDGRVAVWELEWNEEARGLRLAAPAADRAAAAPKVRAAG